MAKKDVAELKACPMCAGKAYVNSINRERWQGRSGCYVSCNRKSCGIHGRIYDSRAKAIAVWNSRTMQEKKEGERTPQGVSYSESESSFYLRIRDDNEIKTIRILKSDPAWETHVIEGPICTCDYSQGWVVGGRDHSPKCPFGKE